MMKHFQLKAGVVNGIYDKLLILTFSKHKCKIYKHTDKPRSYMIEKNATQAIIEFAQHKRAIDKVITSACAAYLKDQHLLPGNSS